MTWKGKEYGIQNLSLGLAPTPSDPEAFDPSQFSIDPGSWLSSASDLLNPESWFESGQEEERVVRAKPMLALSAGFRPIQPVVLAANMSVRNRDAIARGGWTGGATAGCEAHLCAGAWKRASIEAAKMSCGTRCPSVSACAEGWSLD